MFPSSLQDRFLGIFGIMVGLDQMDSYAARCLALRRFFRSGMRKTGIAGWMRRLLLWLQAQMLGIISGMHQKDCCAFGWFCSALRAVFPSL